MFNDQAFDVPINWSDLFGSFFIIFYAPSMHIIFGLVSFFPVSVQRAFDQLPVVRLGKNIFFSQGSKSLVGFFSKIFLKLFFSPIAEKPFETRIKTKKIGKKRFERKIKGSSLNFTNYIFEIRVWYDRLYISVNSIRSNSVIFRYLASFSLLNVFNIFGIWKGFTVHNMNAFSMNCIHFIVFNINRFIHFSCHMFSYTYMYTYICLKRIYVDIEKLDFQLSIFRFFFFVFSFLFHSF